MQHATAAGLVIPGPGPAPDPPPRSFALIFRLFLLSRLKIIRCCQKTQTGRVCCVFKSHRAPCRTTPTPYSSKVTSSMYMVHRLLANFQHLIVMYVLPTLLSNLSDAIRCSVAGQVPYVRSFHSISPSTNPYRMRWRTHGRRFIQFVQQCLSRRPLHLGDGPRSGQRLSWAYRPRGVHSKGPLFLRGMMSIADLTTLRLDCPTTCAMCDVTPLPVPPDDKRCLPRHPSGRGGPSFLYIPQSLCSPIPSPKTSPYQRSNLSSPPSNGSSCLTRIAPPTRM